MEFFVVMNSFAAPFFSDTSEKFVEADNLDECKRKVLAEYTHPCGLYAAMVYANANDYHKGRDPIAKYLCNLERRKKEATKGLPAYTMQGLSKNAFRVDGKTYTAEDGGGWE